MGFGCSAGVIDTHYGGEEEEEEDSPLTYASHHVPHLMQCTVDRNRVVIAAYLYRVVTGAADQEPLPIERQTPNSFLQREGRGLRGLG